MKAAIKQIKRFIDAASKAGCSEDEAAVDATLRKIGSYEQGEAMAKDTKTADELLKMLHERIQGFQLGLEPNPQWVKIVPVSDNIRALEGFSWPQNWKVSHGPKMEPPGDYWKAIERVMPELQEKYELK